MRDDIQHQEVSDSLSWKELFWVMKCVFENEKCMVSRTLFSKSHFEFSQQCTKSANKAKCWFSTPEAFHSRKRVWKFYVKTCWSRMENINMKQGKHWQRSVFCSDLTMAAADEVVCAPYSVLQLARPQQAPNMAPSWEHHQWEAISHFQDFWPQAD